MRNCIKKEEELRSLRTYLDRQELPLSILEEKYFFTEKQKEFLCHKVDFYDEEEWEEYEEMTNEPIPKIQRSAKNQIAIFKRLDVLYPNIRKELSSSYNQLEKLQTQMRKIKRYFYKNGIDCTREQQYSSLLLGIPDESKKEVIEKYDTYKEVEKQYIEVEKKHKQYIQKLDDLKKENPEYDLLLNQLVQSNIALVDWVIKNYFYEEDFDSEEIRAFGLEGLSKAILFYQVSNNTCFSTFAVNVIISTIRHNAKVLTGDYWNTYKEKIYRGEIENQAIMQNISEDEVKTPHFFRVSGVRQIFEEEISLEELSLCEENQWFDRAMMPLTFEEYEEVDRFEDYLVDHAYNNKTLQVMGSNIDEEERRQYVENLLSKLNKNDYALVALYFGFNQESNHTMEEVAKMQGCTRENIRVKLKRIKVLLKEKGEALEMQKDWLYDSIRCYREATNDDFLNAIAKLYYMRKFSYPSSTLAFFFQQRFFRG